MGRDIYGAGSEWPNRVGKVVSDNTLHGLGISSHRLGLVE